MTDPIRGSRSSDQLRLDALREIGTIGAGHASTALAEMTGRAIMIDVPAAFVVPVDEVGALLGLTGKNVVSVMLRTLGDLTGRAFFVLPDEDAHRLACVLVDGPPSAAGDFSVMERSSIEEAGNVVVAAYLNALSEFLGMMSMPSVPTLMQGEAASIITEEVEESGAWSDIVVCIATRFAFRDSGDSIAGHYIFLPDATALKSILTVLKLD